MNSVYSTGNSIVDENARLNISGNIIPQIWYKTIIKDNGKPYLTAIVILSDIVYWYKPTEIRDEGNGQVIAMKKRFSADLLQRNYQQLAEAFGISKKEATSAIVFLEKLGVIKRVFRTVNMNGIMINNVLYLELVVERLRELTFIHRQTQEIPVTPKGERGQHGKAEPGEEVPVSAENSSANSNKETPPPLKRDRVPPEKGIAISWKRDRPLPEKGIPVTPNGDTYTEIITETTTGDYPIISYHRVQEAFKEQIGYDAICCDRPYEIEQLNELVDVAVDVLTSTKREIRINKEYKPAEVVKSVYRKMNIFTMKFVMDSLKESATRVRNMRAVMMTALYNAPMTHSNFVENQFSVHEKQAALSP